MACAMHNSAYRIHQTIEILHTFCSLHKYQDVLHKMCVFVFKRNLKNFNQNQQKKVLHNFTVFRIVFFLPFVVHAILVSGATEVKP